MQQCSMLADVLNTGVTSGGRRVWLWDILNIQFGRGNSSCSWVAERLSSFVLEPLNLVLNLLEFELSLQLMKEFLFALEFSLKGLVDV